jgi:hypothetical protein
MQQFPRTVPRGSIAQLPRFASRAAKQWTEMDGFVLVAARNRRKAVN